MRRSIFYSERLGDFVVDEMCECGHLKSDHGSLNVRLDESIVREPNDGSCCAGSCHCEKFTFARFVTLEEVAGPVRQRQAVK